MDEHTLDCKVSNSKTECTYTMQPAGMNENGQAGAIELAGETNFKDDSWTASAGLCMGGMEVGPMKPWTSIKCETNNAGEHSLSYGQTVCMDDLSAGFKVCADKSAALTSASAAAVMKCDEQKYYARADILNKFFGIGASFNYAMFNMGMKHAAEL